MIEVWKPWRDGTYEISSEGRIRRAKPGISTYVGRPLKPICGPTGYPQAQLVSDSKKHRVYVHHAVMESFVGPRPAGIVVNHKDGDKQNNRLANLEYVSQRENVLHAIKSAQRERGPCMPKLPKKGKQIGEMHWTNRMPERIARADRMPHAKLTADMVRKARERVLTGEKQCAIAQEYGVSVAQMSRIIKGKRWTSV